MKHLEEQLAAYLDGELDPAELAEVRSHLHTCAKCRQDLEAMQRLSKAFKASRPEVPSQRMWRNIQSRLGVEDQGPSGATLWDLLEGWGLTLPRLGMAMAACLGLVLVVMVGVKPPAPKQEAAPEASRQEKKVSPAQAQVRAAKAGSRDKQAKRAAESGSGEAMPQASAPAAAPADNLASAMKMAAGLDSDKDAYTPAPRHTMRPVVAARKASTGGPYLVNAMEPEIAAAPPGREGSATVLPAASGGVNANGLWDWSYFSKAVAGRQWLEAAAELKAARKQAEPGSERSFAATMIHLLSLPGQPLNSVGLKPESESWSSADVKLVLIQANSWRLAGDGNSARFGGEVMTRLKGFRTVGNGFYYHFSGRQAIFEPGTRFTRLANEPAVRVKDSEGKDFMGNEFTIMDNAVYDFSKDVIHLKADQGVQP